MRRGKDNQLWISVCGLFILLQGCAIFPTKDETAKSTPIENPFGNFYDTGKSQQSSVFFRSKKGDRSLEVELPGREKEMTDFVVPMGGAFKNTGMDMWRSPASNGMRFPDEDSSEEVKQRTPTLTDREITSQFSKVKGEDGFKQNQIEQGLGLVQSEDGIPERNTSYLQQTSKVKALYERGRYEDALLQIDDLIRNYPTDPKMYEMRGTILDVLGHRELAMKSWTQALEFNPSNDPLRKFITRKKAASVGRGVASQ